MSEWTKHTVTIREHPPIDKVLLVFSPTFGMGWAKWDGSYARDNWNWVERRIDGSTQIPDVTHWMKIDVPSD